MPKFTLLLLVAALWILPGFIFFNIPASSAAETQSQVPVSSNFVIDFNALTGTAGDLLTGCGFNLEEEIGDEGSLHISAEVGRLKVGTSGPTLAMLAKRGLSHALPEIFEITWGVERFPVGANWGRGNRREALMVILLFGAPLPSGSFYLPDMPLFLGFFLGEQEPLLEAFPSEHYPDTGRYVCLGNPTPGQTITTRLDLRDIFRDWFGK